MPGMPGPAGPAGPRQIEYLPLDEIEPATRNPKHHALRDVVASIRRFGWTAPVILDERTSRLVAGHGRLAALRIIRDENRPAPEGVVPTTDSGWLVPVVRGWSSRDDAHAEAMIVADNRLTESGGWDDRLLAEVLEDIQEYSPDLLHDAGFTDDYLKTLLAEFDGEEAEKELKDAKDKEPSPRQLGLDAIFTVSPQHLGARIAYECGLKIGTQSSDTGALKNRDRWEWRFPLTFIDNEWHDYDHQRHVDFVAAFKPKYATVRDVMTKAQCEAAGVAYYSLDEILRMAEEVDQHAENVMLIPKYDCIADIPEKFMLGYSVQSSYGATPLPASRFIGRRVHLLGGSWANQRRYLSILGESCVSIDFNHCLNIARFGSFNLPDGSTSQLVQDHGLHPSNGGLVALALSLGNIGRAIHELTNGASAAGPDDLQEPPDDDVLSTDDTYREVLP